MNPTTPQEGNASGNQPRVMSEEVYHGLAGEVVQVLLPYSEADPHALLTTFLVLFGNRAGSGNTYEFGPGAKHHTNENLVIMGATGEGRKSNSVKSVMGLWNLVEDSFTASPSYCSGLSSGEGLIHAIRDGHSGADGHDPGVSDKRLFVRLDEFASIFTAMNREGNNLAQYVRQAFDSETIQSLIKRDPQKVTGPHVSIVGCITPTEMADILAAKKNQSRSSDGSINRYLWVSVRRSKRIALLDDDEVAEIKAGMTVVASGVKQALEAARVQPHSLRWTAAAEELWRDVYESNTVIEGTEGYIGRREAHICRLTMIYALLDGSSYLDVHHLTAAVEVYRYCRDSALLAFQGSAGLNRYLRGQDDGPAAEDSSSSSTSSELGRDERKLLDYIRSHEQVSRTEITIHVFKRNKRKSQIDKMIQSLQEKELVYCKVDTSSSPSTEWYMPTAIDELTNYTNCTNYTHEELILEGRENGNDIHLLGHMQPSETVARAELW